MTRVAASDQPIRSAAEVSQVRPTGRGWDLLIVGLLALAAGAASFFAAGLLDPILHDRGAFDVWFDADIPRVYENMLQRLSDHSRTYLHPLFALMGFPPTYLLHKVLGFGADESVRFTIALVASLWSTLLFVLLRLLGCARLDAVLFTALGAASAAAVFGLVIPETFSFGSVTILLALVFLAWSGRRPLGRAWDVVISALTLSATVTNWMAGLLVTFFRNRPRTFVRITLDAVLLIGMLWAIQKVVFPSADFIVSRRTATVVNHVLREEAGGLPHILQAFFCHSMVMPAFHEADIHMWQPFFLGWQRMSAQLAPAGSATGWGLVAVALWLGLLAVGLSSFLCDRRRSRFRAVFGLLVLGQLGLHLLFGYETFLFSMHYAPLLIVLAAWATLSRARILVRALTVALLVTVTINNTVVFARARDYVTSHVTPRQQARLAALERPADPWPRGEGHVVVAWPGSPREQKGYLEPGGSFSPGPGSFGVSIWQLDRNGGVLTTSDTIALDEVTQSIVVPGDEGGPGVRTETPGYVARWQAMAPGRFRLLLEWPHGARERAVILIRAVGPAGGAIHSISRQGTTLRVEDRWHLELSPAPARIVLGEEGPSGWRWDAADGRRIESPSGWACARIELASNRTRLEITDGEGRQAAVGELRDVATTLRCDLPDGRFVASLRAQVAHLLMGLVGDETRPADPTDYLRSSTREGAEITVALARAGYLDVARRLAVEMARSDFQGPFGPEADQPGHALWAIETVARTLHDGEFDAALWPHVHRKAEWIMRMVDAGGPIWRERPGDAMTQMVDGRVTRAKDPVCLVEAARDGLIEGAVSWSHHRLFLNAISLRGLEDAAALAERAGHADDAGRWRKRAARMRAAWREVAEHETGADIWTYSNAVWPARLIGPRDRALLAELESHWPRIATRIKDEKRWPEPDRLDLAEAHAWLCLGRTERVWRILHWFWDEQVSPGLYTWRAGGGTRVMCGAWPEVRGYVDPRGSTPDYGAAARMLLTQLDLLVREIAPAPLANVDPSGPAPEDTGTGRPAEATGSRPTLLIGAGMPGNWLTHRMSVAGIRAGGREVNWSWDGGVLHVQLRGGPAQVLLGDAFAPGTRLEVRSSRETMARRAPEPPVQDAPPCQSHPTAVR